MWKKMYRHLNSSIYKVTEKFYFEIKQTVHFYYCLLFWLYVIIMSRMRFRVNPHLYLPECQGTSCSKQVRYMKFK